MLHKRSSYAARAHVRRIPCSYRPYFPDTIEHVTYCKRLPVYKQPEQNGPPISPDLSCIEYAWDVFGRSGAKQHTARYSTVP